MKRLILRLLITTLIALGAVSCKQVDCGSCVEEIDTSSQSITVTNDASVDRIYIEIEKAYFEGQRDAINGDVRIKLTEDGIYVWTKSCWNSGKAPQYNPTYLDSQPEELTYSPFD